MSLAPFANPPPLLFIKNVYFYLFLKINYVLQSLRKGGEVLFEESIKLAIRSRYTKNPLRVAQKGFDQTYY